LNCDHSTAVSYSGVAITAAVTTAAAWDSNRAFVTTLQLPLSVSTGQQRFWAKISARGARGRLDRTTKLVYKTTIAKKNGKHIYNVQTYSQ